MYDEMMPHADKFLRPDGSVATASGEVIVPASEEGRRRYAESMPIVVKYIHADGTVDDDPGQGGVADVRLGGESVVDGGVADITISALFLASHPPGSVYETTNEDESTPEKMRSKYGGEWQRLTDRVLIGAGSSYPVNSTGGADETQYTPSGSVAIGGHKLTQNEIPSHRHYVDKFPIYTVSGATEGRLGCIREDGSGDTLNSQFRVRSSRSSSYSFVGYHPYVAGDTNKTGGDAEHSHQGTFEGSQAGISTVQPYYAVYIFRRTG